jgi:hypothetical protein
VVGSCEHGSEPTGSIKCWEVLEWLHNWQLLKKGSSPWVSEWVSTFEHTINRPRYGGIQYAVAVALLWSISVHPANSGMKCWSPRLASYNRRSNKYADNRCGSGFTLIFPCFLRECDLVFALRMSDVQRVHTFLLWILREMNSYRGSSVCFSVTRPTCFPPEAVNRFLLKLTDICTGHCILSSATATLYCHRQPSQYPGDYELETFPIHRFPLISPWIEPIVLRWLCFEWNFVKRFFLRWLVFSLTPNVPIGGPLLAGCPLLPIQYCDVFGVCIAFTSRLSYTNVLVCFSTNACVFFY